MKKLSYLLLVVIHLSASASFAGTIDLSALYNGGAPFVGDTVMFSDIIESNGAPADPAIHFMQDPLIFGDRIDFNPTGFRAEVAPGPGSETYQTSITLTLMADPGHGISGLCFHEEGDYQTFGNGSVNATLNVDWEEVTTGAPASGSSTETFAASGASNGLWDLDLNVPVTGLPNKIEVTFQNIITAEALDGVSLGFIAKKQFNGLEVKTEEVPEPTTALIGIMGLIATLGIRRKI